MSEITPWQFDDTVRQIAGSHYPADLALTIARMLAAARFWTNDSDGFPNIYDQSRELTQSDWLAIVDQLARQWGPGTSASSNPFKTPAERHFQAPGALEQLRRLVLACLHRKGHAPSMPSWLLQSTLELVGRRGPFSASMDEDARLLIAKVAVSGPTTRAFCAYDGAASIALELASQGIAVRLDVQQQELAALCGCLAIGAELPLQVRHGDPLALAREDNLLEIQPHELFDVSVVVPPFGSSHSPQAQDDLGTALPLPPNSEAAGVVLALARGRRAALCLLPTSFLFKATKADQLFKERAICDYGLDTIIRFPRMASGGASIITGLLVFKPGLGSMTRRQRPSSVFMVDVKEIGQGSRRHIDVADMTTVIRDRAETDISIAVPFEELATNDFNLSVERYVLEPEVRRLRALSKTMPTVTLEDIAELYRPQSIASVKGAETTFPPFFAEVGVADIDEVGLVRLAGKQIEILPNAARQARKASLEAGDVLLVIKGSVGKVGFIRDIPDDATWLASQSFVILRLRPHAPIIDPRVLFRFLSSPLGQANLQSLRVGSAVPGLQMADVRRQAVFLPSVGEQKIIASEVDSLFALQDQIQQLRVTVASTQARLWPEEPPLLPS